jgi:hypothetical protein
MYHAAIIFLFRYKFSIILRILVMKCQHCGNELVPDEVFCGQCGNPNATPVQATEMMQAPSFKNGLPGANQSRPNQSAIRQNQGSQQQGGFYQDATEALSSMAPGMQYPQQGFQNSPGMTSGYNNSGQFGTQAQQQPFLTGNYPPNMTYPPTATGFASGQTYGSRAEAPQKRTNALMVAGIVCLIFAIITVGAVGTLFVLKGANNNQSSTPSPVVQATATATATPSPTPSPTATPSPTPTVIPTAAPDANFSWCGTQCTQNGYQIEFPNGWVQGAAQSGPGIQFTNPGNADTIYAAVKTPSSGSSSASDLISADVANFSGQTNFTGPQSVLSATIGGENWSYSIITYQLNSQTEQVNIYATIHQGKGYVVELQAAQAQFPSINTQFFGPMIASFQFVAVTA